MDPIRKLPKSAYRLQEALDEWNFKYELSLSEADILAFAQEGRIGLSFPLFDEKVGLQASGTQRIVNFTGYLPLEQKHAFEIRARQYCDIRDTTLSDGGLVRIIGEHGIKVSASKLYISGEEFVSFEEGELTLLQPNTVPNQWPWGAHETGLLRHLAEAGKKFWRLYDPADPTTAPTNAQVIEWLEERGVASRNAEIIATLLRANGLPQGQESHYPRPKICLF